jgi:uncharacterized membrane protein
VCTCSGGFIGTTCATKAVTWLDGAGCRAAGISGDASVVVGACIAAKVSSAVRWNGVTKTTLAPYSGGAQASALGVSKNGLVIVGWSLDSSSERLAVRWVGGTANNYQHYAQVDSYEDEARRTSSDGAVSVGIASRAGEYASGARWATFTGAPTYLAAGKGHDYSYATGVSADGNTVVGYATDESDGFVWTASGGYASLPGLNGSTDNEALAVSDDGHVIVGASGGVATRWVDKVPSSLGSIGEGIAASSDGSVIVGMIGNDPFVWTSAAGIRPLATVLSGLGVTMSGYTLARVTDLSDDGHVIVGYGSDGSSDRAFRITLP